MLKFKLNDVVALTKDLPEHNLLKGQVGTIVEIHKKDFFDVEFSDDLGKTYALLTLKSTQLTQLHFSPNKRNSIYVQ
jgi:hypothetical protein